MFKFLSLKNSRTVKLILIACFILLISACSNDSSTEVNKNLDNDEIEQTDETEATNEAEKLSLEEAKELTNDLLSGIIGTYVDLGQQYTWTNYENPADFNILRPELKKYATDKLVEGYLKDIADEYYCECDMRFFPYPDFDARFTLHEMEDGKFSASSIEFINELGHGGNTVYFTVKKENGKWLMDHFEAKSYEEEPLNVTAEEVMIAYEKMYSHTKVELLNEGMHEGKKVFIINIPEYNLRFGVYADSTDMLYAIPRELLPEELVKFTPEQAVQLVRERLGYVNRPDITVHYDHDTEFGYYSIQVFTMPPGNGSTQTLGWYEVDPLTGDIYDSLSGGKLE